MRDAALKAGAREAYLIEEPLAAAIGANVPISGPSGNMIIDIGGGTSEIAVIALGGIVVSHARCASAATASTRRSPSYIRKKYNLMIGERTAEEVKIAIGTALPLERELHDGGPRPRPHRRPAADDPDHQLRGHGGASRRRSSSSSPRSAPCSRRRRPSCRQRHHRQGHGHVRRRRAAAQHRQAADPGHRRALPRRRERRSTASPSARASRSSTSTSSRSRSSSRSDVDAGPSPARHAPGTRRCAYGARAHVAPDATRAA